MAPVITAWTHGHAGLLQATTGFLHERIGYCLRLKADAEGEVWVHYAVPLAVANSAPRRVSGVSLQLRTWGSGRITAVRLFDGAQQVFSAETDLSAPVAALRYEDDGEDLWDILHVEFETDAPMRAAVGLSLLVAGSRARDAVGIAAVGVTTMPAGRAN